MTLLGLLYKYGLTLEVVSRARGNDQRTYVVVTAPDGRAFRVLLKDADANRAQFIRDLVRWVKSQYGEEQ